MTQTHFRGHWLRSCKAHTNAHSTDDALKAIRIELKECDRIWSAHRCNDRLAEEMNHRGWHGWVPKCLIERRGIAQKHMNWEQIEGKWKQLTGSVRERWGKLTDDDVQTLTGQKDQLVGKIQERYGFANAEAEKQAEAWCHALKDTCHETSQTVA